MLIKIHIKLISAVILNKQPIRALLLSRINHYVYHFKLCIQITFGAKFQITLILL